jgi:hypothetical protein
MNPNLRTHGKHTFRTLRYGEVNYGITNEKKRVVHSCPSTNDVFVGVCSLWLVSNIINLYIVYNMNNTWLSHNNPPTSKSLDLWQTLLENKGHGNFQLPPLLVIDLGYLGR